MRAVVRYKYGSPDVLQLKKVEEPTLKDNEALVKARAASLDAGDLKNLRGVFMVCMGAPRQPRYQILGSDIAGGAKRLAET